MSMKHTTPGPWHVGENAPAIVYDAEGWAICNAVTYHNRGGDMAANARLIAAAPELVFHLLAAANYIDALGGDSKSYRIVIAKALGSDQ